MPCLQGCKARLTEDISTDHLGRLYKGEFPNGETAPNKLRIHWTNARALAQAEVELQKDILGWADAEVSPRPILVNDPNEKFYRYYEYRILKGDKEIGAVRIPAYRRTENFATAEVHQYNGSGSYTVKPTGWGKYMIDQSQLKKGSKFYSLMLKDIGVLIENKNFAFNWYDRYFSKSQLTTNSKAVNPTDTYWMLYNVLSQMVNDINIPSKKSLGAEKKQYIAAKYVYDRQYTLADTLTSVYRIYSQGQAVSKLIEDYEGAYISPLYMVAYNNIYKQTINVILNYMSVNTESWADRGVHKSLSSIYWSTIEETMHSNVIVLLQSQWENLGDFLVDEKVTPKIAYKNVGLLGKYREDKAGVLRYSYVSDEVFTLAQNPSFFFDYKNSKGEDVAVSFTEEKIAESEYIPLLKSSLPAAVETPSKLDSDKELFSLTLAADQIYDIVQADFPKMETKLLKSKIISLIGSQANISSLYFSGNSKDTILSQKQNYGVLVGGMVMGSALTGNPFVGGFMAGSFLLSDIHAVYANLDDIYKSPAYQKANAILNKYHDNIWGFNETMPVHFASGVAFKSIKSEMEFLSKNLEQIREVYDFLVQDYRAVLFEVYQAKGKAAANQMYELMKFLESIIRNNGDLQEAILDAYNRLVRKWLLWYVPIFPWPMGHFCSYGKAGGVWCRSDPHSIYKPKPGYFPLPDRKRRLPIALAQIWMNMEVGSAPVKKPEDEPDQSSYIIEGTVLTNMPEGVDRQVAVWMWQEIWDWLLTNPDIETRITREKYNDLIDAMTTNKGGPAKRIDKVLVGYYDDVHFINRSDWQPLWWVSYCMDLNPPKSNSVFLDPSLGSWMMPVGRPGYHYPPNSAGVGSDFTLLPSRYQENVIKYDYIMTNKNGAKIVDGFFNDRYAYEYIELYIHPAGERHRTLDDTKVPFSTLPPLGTVAWKERVAEIYRFMNNKQQLDMSLLTPEPVYGPNDSSIFIGGDPRRGGGFNKRGGLATTLQEVFGTSISTPEFKFSDSLMDAVNQIDTKPTVHP